MSLDWKYDYQIAQMLLNKLTLHFRAVFHGSKMPTEAIAKCIERSKNLKRELDFSYSQFDTEIWQKLITHVPNMKDLETFSMHHINARNKQIVTLSGYLATLANEYKLVRMHFEMPWIRTHLQELFTKDDDKSYVRDTAEKGWYLFRHGAMAVPGVNIVFGGLTSVASAELKMIVRTTGKKFGTLDQGVEFRRAVRNLCQINKDNIGWIYCYLNLDGIENWELLGNLKEDLKSAYFPNRYNISFNAL